MRGHGLLECTPVAVELGEDARHGERVRRWVVVIGNPLGAARGHCNVVRQARARLGIEVRGNAAVLRQGVDVRRSRRADDVRVPLVLHHDPDDVLVAHRRLALHPAGATRQNVRFGRGLLAGKCNADREPNREHAYQDQRCGIQGRSWSNAEHDTIARRVVPSNIHARVLPACRELENDLTRLAADFVSRSCLRRR